MSRQPRYKKRGGGRGPGRATSWVYPFEVRREVVHEIVERKTPLSLVSKAFYISEMTIRNWLVAYQLGGEAALMPKTAGRKPSPLDRSDPVVAAVTALKEEHPEYGARRIRDVIQRFEALGVSETTVRRVLAETGMTTASATGRVERGERPPRRFERAAPNQLWQSDIFTFLLRRHERLYLTAFMDDHSRFLVSFVLAHHQKGSLVLEALERGVAGFGVPQEVLTDQGRQYTAWRGETLFEERLRQYGIRHIKSRPQHPETLGKIERFWKTLWDEFLSRTVFADFADCQRRLGLFVEGYNFQRPHQALGGLVPADRYFRAAPQVRAAIEKNIEANALRKAQQQPAQKPFYLVGRLGDQDLSIAAEGPGLRVRLGNEQPQTITMPKENADEDQAIPTRFRNSPPEHQAAADAAVAHDEHRARPDRAAPMREAPERPVWGDLGDGGDRGDADLERDILQAGDHGAGGDAHRADPWGRGGFEHRRHADGTAASLGREGEEARAGEAPGREATSLDAPGGQAGAFEGQGWETTWEPQRGAQTADAEAGRAELDADTAFRIDRAFDPDEGWRERAEKWERKLTGASAPTGILSPEESHGPTGQENAELRGGTTNTQRDAAALSDDPGRHVRTAERERGSAAPLDESQPFPESPASGGEGHAAVGHSQAGGSASDAGAGGRAADRAVAAPEGERTPEDAQRSGGAAAGSGWGLGTREDRSTGAPIQTSENKDPSQ
jgi:transposase InsO family protein